MFKPQYNKDESYIVRARCSLCDVQLPKMTLTNFKAFVCVCQRNLNSPSNYDTKKNDQSTTEIIIDK